MSEIKRYQPNYSMCLVYPHLVLYREELDGEFVSYEDYACLAADLATEREKNARLEKENARLMEPVSDEEWSILCKKGRDSCYWKNIRPELDSLLAARVNPEPQKEAEA